jgi:multidrug resistance efflux pump
LAVNKNNSMPNLRSEQINEFINSKPPWMVRRGITLFFIITLLLIAATWFIQYPDIVNVNAKVQSLNPPKEVMAKSGGRLIKLLKTDSGTVQKGDIIGYIESTASHEQVLALSNLLQQLKGLADSARLEELPNYWKTHQANFSQLGDLQTTHQTFVQAFLTFKNYLSSGFYASKKQMLRRDLVNIKKLYGNLITQKELQTQDYALAQKNYEMNDALHKEQLINDFEMRGQKSQLLSKKMSIPQMSASLIGNESQQYAIEKEMLDLDNQILQQRNIFVESLFTYINTIEDWKQKYLLLAPTNGKLAFSSFVSENQILEANKPVCYVTNETNQYTVEVLIPQFVISKVKPGMEISLKFPGYPYQEYGTVKGTIEYIKGIPVDSGFMARVILKNGLVTNYGKLIAFKNGLTAQGEIFTENKRLLMKIFNGIKK